jgi:glutamine amidotransferase
MKPKIAVIDYGMGNLRSVSKAIELCGANVEIITKAKQIRNYSAIVLPGVGSFAPAIKIIKSKKFDVAIKEHIKSGKMFLGICLGFQLLFTKSYEEGVYKGLDIIKGTVKKFKAKRNKRLIIPHMCWNKINKSKNPYAKQMYKNIKNKTYFYFVHSYYCDPRDKKLLATTTNYDMDFCSSIATKNIWASQFHPEKSSTAGLAILKNFVKKVK